MFVRRLLEAIAWCVFVRRLLEAIAWCVCKTVGGGEAVVQCGDGWWRQWCSVGTVGGGSVTVWGRLVEAVVWGRFVKAVVWCACCGGG